MWVVLERGVLHYFASRAEAASHNDAKRMDYKYLDNARVVPQSENATSFIIHVCISNTTIVQRSCNKDFWYSLTMVLCID